ncbi:MAG: hypothetical protein K2Q26_04170 [Bdellovibrionales bacterium]|nr:hypothetical protein [Bdellovibrionales bacterium]
MTDLASELKIFRNPFKLDEGKNLHLRFGPMDLYMGHFHQEWRVSWSTTNEYTDNSFRLDHDYTGPIPDVFSSEKRYTYSRQTNSFVKMTPVLGDLAYVAKPSKPLMVLPGETVKIFMSTPLFLRLESENPYNLIEEIPILQSPKTWFGQNTITGEVCYSTRIKAVLDKKDLTYRPYRAVSQLIIDNRGSNPLHVEKLKVPSPYLALFQNDQGEFITSVIQYIRHPSGEIRTVDVLDPQDGEELFFMSGPRLRTDHSLLDPIAHFFGGKI